MTAWDKLQNKFQTGLHICVGLDSDIKRLPEHLRNFDDPVLEFNKQIIEATKNKAAAYKLNLAFYEKDGIAGQKRLEQTLEFIPDDILTIGDAKRGDIGNTSKMYAKAIFDYLNFDASTLHPYMGFDSVQPFLEYNNKLNFILVLTSNPSNKDFEKLETTNGKFLYQEVLLKVTEWNNNKNCGIVFGATNPNELKENLNLFGTLPVLLPGVGSQGGSLEEVVSIFESSGNSNYLVNISRGLIYCDDSEKFAEKTEAKLDYYNSQVNEIILKYNEK